jgi:hypothetical protein
MRKLGLALLCFFFYLSACNQNRKVEDSPSRQKDSTMLDSLKQIVNNTAQRFHSYKNDTLVKILAVESAKRKEPFNSLAYRELQTRSDVSADTLSALVKRVNDGDAILPLLLLRKLSADNYKKVPLELKVNVLTGALKSSKEYNIWGFPPFYLEDASVALLECGRVAFPALKLMLMDTTQAPVFGSQAYMQYLRYRYRRCDYALFFIRKGEDAKFVFPTAFEQRDSLIREILK